MRPYQKYATRYLVNALKKSMHLNAFTPSPPQCPNMYFTEFQNPNPFHMYKGEGGIGYDFWWVFFKGNWETDSQHNLKKCF